MPSSFNTAALLHQSRRVPPTTLSPKSSQMSTSVSSLPRRAKWPSRRHERLQNWGSEIPNGTAVMQRCAEERCQREEAAFAAAKGCQ
jgi:hypothetical protein